VRRAAEPVPLAALFLLQQRPANGAEDPEGAPIMRVTSQKEAALRLRNQAFRPRFVRGLGQEGPNFLALASLQKRVPLATLPLPSSIAAMRDWLERQDLLTAAATAEGPRSGVSGGAPTA
jgi:hypothetical protein